MCVCSDIPDTILGGVVDSICCVVLLRLIVALHCIALHCRIWRQSPDEKSNPCAGAESLTRLGGQGIWLLRLKIARSALTLEGYVLRCSRFVVFKHIK